MEGKQTLAEYLTMLGEIEEMPVLVEKTRKLLKKFVSMLERLGCSKDEYFFQALCLCETAIRNSTAAERSSRSVSGILDALLEIIKLECVCSHVVNECLSTIGSIMQCLDSCEVMDLPDDTKKKLSHLSPLWNKMDNLSTMKAIVRIFYEYVLKYGPNDRLPGFMQATQDFTDPTGKLASIIQWTSESFEINCRHFLNNISEKQYYSLAAPSAVLGEKTLSPLAGCSYICFEWNHNPEELSFEAALDLEEKNTVQAQIALSDIHSIAIIEDMHAPRIECSYKRIAILGDSTEAYELRINALNNEELRALLQYLKHRVPSEKIAIKPLVDVVNHNESVVYHEQLCNDSDITDFAMLSQEKQKEPNTTPTVLCDGGEDAKADTLQEEQAEDPVVEIPKAPSRENEDNSNSLQQYPPLTATKWSFKFIDLSDEQKNSATSYDPYDIAQLQKDGRDRNRTQKHAKGRQGARMTAGTLANGTAAPGKKRPACMISSTPAKRPATAKLQSSVDDIEAISSIYSISDDAQSDTNDSDYVPYIMLSGAGNQRQGSKRLTTIRKQSFPTARKMAERARGDAVRKRPATEKPNSKQCARKTNKKKDKENTPLSTRQAVKSTATTCGKGMIGSKTTTAAKVRTTPAPISNTSGPPEKMNKNACQPIQHSIGLGPLMESSSKNRIAQSATSVSITPDTSATSIRSSVKNCNETVPMGLVPFGSTTRPATSATTIKSIMESNALPRILNLQHRYEEQKRNASNDAQALATKNSAVFKASKEKYEKLMVLRAECDQMECELMSIVKQSNHNIIIEELQRKRKEAEERDKQFLLDLKAEKNNMKTIFQKAKCQYFQLFQNQLKQQLMNIINDKDINIANAI